MKLDIDVDNIILLLNKLLAIEPELVLTLLKNRPEISQEETSKLLQMHGKKVSFLGIINTMLKEHNSNVIIGADCEFDDGEMIYVKFFHPVIYEENNAKDSD